MGDKRELTRENKKNTWCKMKLTTDSKKLARRKKRRNRKSRQNRGKNYKPTTNLFLLNWRCLRCLSDSAVGCRSWLRWCAGGAAGGAASAARASGFGWIGAAMTGFGDERKSKTTQTLDRGNKRRNETKTT